MQSQIISHLRSNFLLYFLLFLASIWRLWIIQTNAIAFNSDEAIVGLMAKHMLEGKPIPIFFYGQVYLGSLDAMFTTLVFSIFGVSVFAIHITQFFLYLISIVVSYYLAYEVSQQKRVALIVAFLVAIPNLLVLHYTFLALGGYTELFILSNIVYLLGWQVTIERSTTWWRWLSLGLAAGLGWWIHGGILVSLAIVGLMGLWHFRIDKSKLYLLALIGFLLGSVVWWVYNFQHDWAALRFLFENNLIDNSTQPEDQACCTPYQKSVIGLLLAGVLAGFREPWGSDFFVTLFSLAALVIYMILITRFIVKERYQWYLARSQTSFPVRYWVILVITIMIIVIMVSGLYDPSGRYLLPITTPLMIGIALGINDMRKVNRFVASLMLTLLVAFHGTTVLQFVEAHRPINQMHDQHEEAVIEFLLDQNLVYGYSDFWTSFRLIFVSNEEIIISSLLPYDENGYKTFSNRYEPYVDEVNEAEHVFWLTYDFADLDEKISCFFEEANLAHSVKKIGDFTIYYDFPYPVSPTEFNLDAKIRLENLSCTHNNKLAPIFG